MEGLISERPRSAAREKGFAKMTGLFASPLHRFVLLRYAKARDYRSTDSPPISLHSPQCRGTNLLFQLKPVSTLRTPRRCRLALAQGYKE